MLKNKDRLLSDLAEHLKRFESMNSRASLGTLEVSLFNEDGECIKKGSLAWAMDVLANDLFWDAESDWRDAASLSVDTI